MECIYTHSDFLLQHSGFSGDKSYESKFSTQDAERVNARLYPLVSIHLGDTSHLIPDDTRSQIWRKPVSIDQVMS